MAGTLPPASATRSSTAPRAMPRPTAPMASASNPNAGKAYSGPGSRAVSEIKDTVRPSGTTSSATSKSLLPVPRSPAADQVSRTVVWRAGISARRTSGVPAAVRRTSSPSWTRQPPMSQSLCAEPLANGQRPVTDRLPLPVGSARPLGANTPATQPRRSPNTSRAGSGSRNAASTPPVAATARHQPAAPSARARSSMSVTIRSGATSPPPSDAGTSMRSIPLSRSPSATSGANRRSVSA